MSILYLTEGSTMISLSRQPCLSQLDYELIKAFHEDTPTERLAKNLGIYPHEAVKLYDDAVKRLRKLSQMDGGTAR